MKALTVQQQYAYLAGVLKGDGWISSGHGRSPNGYLCLRVADRDFADTFAAAITQAFGVPASVRRDERGYWLCRKYNGHQRFSALAWFTPDTDDERRAWLRSLFDSEGNAQLTPLKRGARSFGRRVAIYSTDKATLACAAWDLALLEIQTRTTLHSSSAGHLGTKPVYQLAVVPGPEQYARFRDLIGSSISRKQMTLEAIANSYCTDISAVRREMQLAGVASRRARRDAGGKY